MLNRAQRGAFVIHTCEKGVTFVLFEDTAHPWNMFDGELEHYKRHRGLAHQVVLLEVAVNKVLSWLSSGSKRLLEFLRKYWNIFFIRKNRLPYKQYRFYEKLLINYVIIKIHCWIAGIRYRLTRCRNVTYFGKMYKWGMSENM